MSAEHRSITVESEPGFPAPMRDRLGLARDPIHLSSRTTPAGQEFVLVHSRPLLGESMVTFLDSVVPHSDRGNMYRRRMRSIYAFGDLPSGYDVSKDPPSIGQTDIHALHKGARSGEIGEAIRAFDTDVHREWVQVLSDPSHDSVFAPLPGMMVFGDFSQKAKSTIDGWKAMLKEEDPERDTRQLLDVLSEIAPTDGLRKIKSHYRNIYKDFAKLGQDLANYLDNLSDDDKENIAGMALSRYGSKSLYQPGVYRLIVDLSTKRYWYDKPTHYFEEADYDFSPKRKNLPMDSEIAVTDKGKIVISDDRTGVSIEVDSKDGPDPLKPLRWEITSQTLPDNSKRSGRYAAVAWRVDGLGGREFLTHAETTAAVLDSDVQIEGAPDSYLGKLLLRYFRQPGEQEESTVGRKWLSEMGLPGSTSGKRKIRLQELPAWIQLERHQGDLLNSNFITAAERLAI